MATNSGLRPGYPDFEDLRARAEVGLRRAGVTDGVRLQGGPMSGWYVKRDAPVLEADWYMTWTDAIRHDFSPGRYEVDAGGKYAVWVTD